MASRGHIVKDVPGLVIVHVEHGIADSFSRSVLPTSTRAWRRSINARSATYRASELAPDFADHNGTCTSFVVFGASFADARAALAEHLDTLRPPVTTTT